MAVMEIPKMSPRKIPLALLSLPCIKKLTVMGIMGNTQGVSSASSPSPKASQKKPQSDLMPLQESLAIITTMDKIRKQWKLKYPNE